MKPDWKSMTTFDHSEQTASFAFENVFAAGSVLAHQDWIRTKSGAGLAIATAYGAVNAFRAIVLIESLDP